MTSPVSLRDMQANYADSLRRRLGPPPPPAANLPRHPMLGSVPSGPSIGLPQMPTVNMGQEPYIPSKWGSSGSITGDLENKLEDYQTMRDRGDIPSITDMMLRGADATPLGPGLRLGRAGYNKVMKPFLDTPVGSTISRGLMETILTPLRVSSQAAYNTVDIAKSLAAGEKPTQSLNPLQYISDVLPKFKSVEGAENRNDTAAPTEHVSRPLGRDIIKRATGLTEEKIEENKHVLGPIGARDAVAIPGLAWDIFGDPLTYLGGAGALKLGRVGSMTARGVGPAGATARQVAKAEGTKLPSLITQAQDHAQRGIENWAGTESFRRSVNPNARISAGTVSDFSVGARNIDKSLSSLQPVPVEGLPHSRLSDAPARAVEPAPAGVPGPTATGGQALVPDPSGHGLVAPVEHVPAPKVSPQTAATMGKEITPAKILDVFTDAGESTAKIIEKINQQIPRSRIRLPEEAARMHSRRTKFLDEIFGIKESGKWFGRVSDETVTKLNPELKTFARDFVEEFGDGSKALVEIEGGAQQTFTKKQIDKILRADPSDNPFEDVIRTYASERLVQPLTGSYPVKGLEFEVGGSQLDRMGEIALSEIDEATKAQQLMDYFMENIAEMETLRPTVAKRQIDSVLEAYDKARETQAKLNAFVTTEAAPGSWQRARELDPKGRDIGPRKSLYNALEHQVRNKQISKEEAARIKAADSPKELREVIEDVKNSEYNPFLDPAFEVASPFSAAEEAAIAERAVEPLSQKVSRRISEDMQNPPTEGVDIPRISSAAVNNVIKRRMDPALKNTVYTSETVKGARRTSDAAGEGYANFMNAFNSPNRSILDNHIITDIRKIANERYGVKRPAKGAPNSEWQAYRKAERRANAYVKEHAPQAMAHAERIIREHGGVMFIGNGTKGTPIYMSAVYEELSKTSIGNRALWETGANINLTNLQEAVEFTIENSGRLTGAIGKQGAADAFEELKGILRHQPSATSHEGKKIYNNFGNPKAGGNVGSLSMMGKRVPGIKTTADLVEHNVESLAHALRDRVDLFTEMSEVARYDHRIRTGAQTMELSGEALARLDAATDITMPRADLIDGVMNSDAIIAEKAKEIGATRHAVDGAQTEVKKAIEQISPEQRQWVENAVANHREASKAAQTGEIGGINRARQEQAAKIFEEMEDYTKVFNESISDSDLWLSLAETIETQMEGLTTRRYFGSFHGTKPGGWFKKVFGAHVGGDNVVGFSDLPGQLRNSVRQFVEAKNNHLIETVDSVGGTQAFNKVYEAIRSGSDLSILNAVEMRAAQELQYHLNFVFDTNKTHGITRLAFGNKLVESGIPFENMNSALRRRGLDKIMQYDRSAAIEAAVPDDVYIRIKKQAEANVAKRHPDAHGNSQRTQNRVDKEIEKLLKRENLENFDDNIVAAMADQWRTWEHAPGSDFAQMLMHHDAAIMDVIVESSVTDNLMRLATKHKGVTSTPTAGWVRIKNDGILGSYLPEGQYFHPDVANSLRTVEKMLEKSAEQVPPLLDKMAPILDMWKAGVTIYKPGHHFRNMVGDISQTFYATGRMAPSDFRDAMLIMRRTRGSDGFSWDAVKQALDNPEAFLTKYEGQATYVDRLKFLNGTREAFNEGDKIMSLKLANGESVNLSAEGIYEAASARGATPSVMVREGLLSDTITEGGSVSSKVKAEKLRRNWGTYGLQKLGKRFNISPLANMTAGRPRTAVVNFTRDRDHFARMQHFVAELKQGAKKYKFNSVEDLYDYAAREVRKWHPDGTGFTATEQMKLRQLFPFYMWTRKALPRVIEATLANPGRVLAYPKAMYAFAQRQGIDLESIANPYVQGELYPSFLQTGVTGSVYQNEDGDYYGFSPGVTFEDIVSTFGQGRIGDGIVDSGPVRGAAGMISPLVKTIPELIGGTNWGTGVQITDKSDYLDAQIPGLSWINSLTGVSPTGVLGVDKLFGDEYSPMNRQVDRGNRQAVDPAKITNFALGTSIINQSQPNYRTIAEIEMRDDAKRNR